MGAERPTVGLVMIVRNEEAVLPRLARSLVGVIDRWTVVDTGSTDATVELVPELFAPTPGELLRDEWRGFGPSRNAALVAAEGRTDWLLSLDADHSFHGRVDYGLLSGDLDGVDVEERYGDLRYWLPRLVRSGRGWHWVGRTHEYLSARDGAGRRERTATCWVEHHADGANRPEKFKRDIALLEMDWAERPGDQRTAFYLARSYDDMGDDGGAMEWYARRLPLGGWEEELFYARYRLGACQLRAGLVDEGCGSLWRAWGERPWRAEPLVRLAEHYRSVGSWPLAWRACRLAFAHCGALPQAEGAKPLGEPAGADSLFVDTTATVWGVAYEASIAAWYVGEAVAGGVLSRYLLALPGLPAAVRRSVAANAGFYGLEPAEP